MGKLSVIFLALLLTCSSTAYAQSLSVDKPVLMFSEGAHELRNITVSTAGMSGSIIAIPGSQVVILENPMPIFGGGRSPITFSGGGSKTLYVGFSPTCSGFPDSIVSSSIIFVDKDNKLLGSVIVKGVVQQESSNGGEPFKVATFNTQWLGCPNNDPEDDDLQLTNVAKVIRDVNADVIALQEVTVDYKNSIQILLSKLGSAWDGESVYFSSMSCAQREAIIYKKSRVNLVSSRLMNDAGTYNAWSSGRFPVEFKLNVSAGGKLTPITLVNLHAKAMSDATSYSRRVEASHGLKTLLDGTAYSSQNLIVLGDYNDYVSGSQCASCGASPYKNFVDDATDYRFLTADISGTGYYSLIDHIMISNELFGAYVQGSVKRESAVTSSIDSYRYTTSDHTPNSAEFAFGRAKQNLNLNSTYTMLLSDGSLTLPQSSAEGLAISYAVDSGVSSVATLSGRKLVFSGTGVVRMVAWQAGDAKYLPAAQFFYVKISNTGVAPKIAGLTVLPDTFVELRATVTFTVQAEGTALRYQWRKDGVNISGATQSLYSITNVNNPNIARYSCVVSNDLGSAESAAVSLCVNGMCPNTATATPKNTYTAQLLLYPNPANGELTIDNGAWSAGTVVKIYNLSGTLLATYPTVGKKTNINISQLLSGLYVVSVYSEKGEVGSKLVIRE